MSKIGGKRREVTDDFVKKVGLFEGEVIAINPTLKEFQEDLGFSVKDDKEEIEYIGESKEGNPYLRVEFWIKNTENEDKFKVVFFLEDKIRVNKDETKTQYINNIGNCSWTDDEETLPGWFTKRDYREAKNGEEDFYNFLRIWLGSLDFRDDDTELQLNWKQLMKGDVSDIKEQLGGDFAVPFVSMATVVTKMKEDDDGVEQQIEYQSIYNRQFLPTYCMKYFRVKDYNDESVQAIVSGKELKKLKLHEKFVYNIVGEYGCKDFYKFSELAEYDASENSVASEDAMITEEEASSDY